MANGRIAGVCYFKVDGEQLETTGSVECPLMTVNRETVMGSTRAVGFKETAIAPYIKGTFAFDKDFPIEKISGEIEMTITAELANGKTYVLADAYVVGEVPVSNDDGTVELEFNGSSGEWQ